VASVPPRSQSTQGTFKIKISYIYKGSLWSSHCREVKQIPFVSIYSGKNWGDSHDGTPWCRIRWQQTSEILSVCRRSYRTNNENEC